MNTSDPDKRGLRARVRKTAHDVRTPLTSIAGFAQLLVEDGSVPPHARENSEIILEEARKLSAMLESFFDEVTAKLDEASANGPDER